jgi:hypothetical protein
VYPRIRGDNKFHLSTQSQLLTVVEATTYLSLEQRRDAADHGEHREASRSHQERQKSLNRSWLNSV